ncbi:MAG: cytochrome c [Akkermansiaceae bacterium]|nr:cytochrome c [Akkermansiaceae bacterium]
MKLSTLFLALMTALCSADPVTYDVLPLGTLEKPLILRTYFPDPDLDPSIFSHHGKGGTSPKYNPGKGEDVKGEYKPVKGLPAVIGVNHGPALSYAFDTIECRLLYAWQGGFLDMYPYWGDKEKGNRRSFGYVPHLVGTLIYKAAPLAKDSKPKFIGYQLKNKQPTFQFKLGDEEHTLKINPVIDKALSFKITRTINGKSKSEVITGGELATFQGYPRNLNIKKATVDNGEKLYLNYGCIACHTTDGSKGHGPTFAGLHGKKRTFIGGVAPLAADDSYLLESIKSPHAKTVEGYPPNYMPPYQLKDLDYQSLILFIKSLGQDK